MFEILIDFLVDLDVRLMYFLNVTVHNPVLSEIMPLFHKGAPWRIPLAVGWVALMIFGGAKGRWAGVGAILLVAATDQLSSHLIKPWVERIRPCNVLGHIWLYKDGGWLMTPDPVTQVYKGSFSFTSSHAANTGGQAFWWASLYPKTKWIWIVLAVMIGYSRVYDGVHYPFDVIGGWAAGGLCFLAIWMPARKWGPKPLRAQDQVVPKEFKD